MWSEGELLIQCNSKVTNKRGKDKMEEVSSDADRDRDSPVRALCDA